MNWRLLYKNPTLGIYRVALKMLFRDRTKYFVLLGALTFSTLLMTQQASIFCGIMNWTTATLRNIRAPIWVMDPKVLQVDDTKPLRDTDYTSVRSVPGVAWAVPIHYSLGKAKLPNGDFKSVYLIGLDSTSLIGHPTAILDGNLADIRKPGAIIVDKLANQRFGTKVGDVLELNDHEARVVAMVDAARSFSGLPYFYTTYERATQFAPQQRKLTSYVLTAALPGVDENELVKTISARTGLLAKTEAQFYWQTVDWYMHNTSIPLSFGITVMLGFLVGIAVCGQTFYAFVMENMRNLATLKAMGATNNVLAKMLLLQTLTMGGMGYGIGIGLASFFGLLIFTATPPPFYMAPQVILLTFVLMIIICLFATFLGWRQVRNIEADIVFRG
jgi:putative ABC transport system permease protein